MVDNNNIDAGQALTYMFDEADWVKKFLIGVLMVLLSWLIVPVIFLQGYMIGIARRVSRGLSPALPEWEDWGTFFSDGAVYIIAGLVYALPMILVVCCGAFALSAGADPNGDLSGVAALLLCCLILLAILYALAISVLLYAGTVNYIKKGNISAFFEFGNLWNSLRTHTGKYGLVFLVAIAVGIVGGFVPLLGTVWSQYATGNLLGQLARTTTGPAPFTDVEGPLAA